MLDQLNKATEILKIKAALKFKSDIADRTVMATLSDDEEKEDLAMLSELSEKADQYIVSVLKKMSGADQEVLGQQLFKWIE